MTVGNVLAALKGVNGSLTMIGYTGRNRIPKMRSYMTDTVEGSLKSIKRFC